MAKEIAVLTDAAGQLAPWTAGGSLTVFRRENGVWRERDACSVGLDASGGLSGLRRQMAGVIEMLGGCDIVLAAAVTGVPYFELEKADVAIWEMQGAFEKELLETVLQEAALAEQARRQVQPAAVPVPEHLGNGHYRISIKEVQENGGATSKQVLQGFLQKGCYEQVDIICAHVPPWLEGEFAGGALAGTVEKTANGTRLTVRRAEKEGRKEG